MTYLRNHLGANSGSQQEALPGQAANNAGGYSWTLDRSERLDRFLILGTEGGTYYATERKLTTDNVKLLDEILAQDGRDIVQHIARVVEISESGRAPKNDPALFVLAYFAKKGNDLARAKAFEALPRVARTGTHLMHFAAFVNALGGWGRGTRRAVADWYNTKDVNSLAYQMVKYQSRDGWSNRDLLRLSHAKPRTPAHDSLYRWAVGKERMGEMRPQLVEAFEEAKTASVGRLLDLIRIHNLPREAIPSQHLKLPEVWWALLDAGSYTDKTAMGATALVRNLATMTRAGALGFMVHDASHYTGRVIAALSDENYIRRSKIHPIQVLSALKTYAQGHGERGDNVWTPVQGIVDALDAAFYTSFGNVVPAGKRTVLGLDISGSMFSGTIAGVPGLTPAVAAGAMAVVTMASEPSCEAYGFTTRRVRGFGGYDYATNTMFESLALSPRRRLDDNLEVMREASNRMGGTDCALPIEWAIENKREVDTFIVYTDNETYAPRRHPSEALKDYRRRYNPRAKLVVVGLTATQFTIADPNDPGSLDVVGFDAAAPALINDFARG